MNKRNEVQLAGGKISCSSGRYSARQILLSCTTPEMAPDEKGRVSALLSGTVDWKYLIELAEFHGVSPILASNLTKDMFSDNIPEHCLETLKQTYKKNLYVNIIITNEFSRVFSTFSQYKVDAIALKGTALAEQLYGNPALRTSGDIDILVRPEQLSRAGSLLQDMGYERFIDERVENHPFHEIYIGKKQRPSCIELHWKLDNDKLVSIPHEKIWKRSQPAKIHGSDTRLLSPEDNLLFLSIHLIKNTEQLLKYLRDITELIQRYNQTLDWDYIIESAHSWGVETGVYYSLKIARELLGAPVPLSAIMALKPEGWRRLLVNILVNKQYLISATKLTKLRAETSAIFLSLMMKRAKQMFLVLSNHRRQGRLEKYKGLRAFLWIVLVFSAALGRDAIRPLSLCK